MLVQTLTERIHSEYAEVRIVYVMNAQIEVFEGAYVTSVYRRISVGRDLARKLKTPLVTT